MTIMGILLLLLASVSGFLLAQLFSFLPRSFRLLIAPALGFIITTEIILLVSLVIGFSTMSIWLAGIITFCVSALVFRNTQKEKYKHPTSHFSLPALSAVEGLTSHVKSYWPLWFTFLTLGVFVFYIFLTQVLTPGPNEALMVGGGGLYGDTALHSAYTMSIVEQGLPPQNPLFAGIPLIYPFLVNLFSGSLVKLGMSLRWAFVIPQLAYFGAMLTLFYHIARKFNRNFGVFLAILIFFLGSGLGFTRYIKDAQTSGNWSITREYTNNLDNFHFHNVLTGLIFPERSFLPGLVIGLLITVLVIEQWNLSTSLRVNNGTIKQSSTQKSNLSQFITHNSQFIILGALLGALPLWHMHTFLFFAVAVAVWILLIFYNFVILGSPKGDSRIRPKTAPELTSFAKMTKLLKPLFTIYIIAFLLTLPVFLWFSQQVSHESFIKFSTGWMNQGKDFFSFWWQNSGLLFPLSLLGVYFLPKKHKLFFIPVFVLFIIANTIVFQPWDWDNIKLFSWILLFSSILVGHALIQLWQIRLLRPVLIIIFVSLIATGSLSLIHATPQQYTLYDNQDIALAEWIKTHTNPSDIFLIDPYATHPVPGLSGRSAYVGYPGHLWVHGIKYGDREQLAKMVLSGNVTALQTSEVPIRYVIIPHQLLSLFPSQSAIFQNAKFAVLQTVDIQSR